MFNRNYLEILIDFNRKIAKGAHPLSVILIDADNFKYFNDQYGHDFGDKVFSSVAALMSGKLRESDYIGRFGGDEFLDFAAAHPAGGGFRYCTADSGRASMLNIENSFEVIGVSMGIPRSPAIRN